MKYKISTVDKKSIIEKNFYEKDGKTFHIEQGYRWGYFETEDPIDIEELKNNDELMIYKFDVTDHCFSDGCWIEFYYDDEITEEEREAIEAAWEEDSYEGIEGLGWYDDEYEVWFLGPLEVEEVTDDDSIEDHERV